MEPIRISGLGCTLLDFVYNGVDFGGPGFTRYLSREPGDGGLTPGQLVFLEDLEKFAGKDFEVIIREIVGEREPDTFNVGGPAIVSIIHAAQLLGENAEIRFFASIGQDWAGDQILDILSKTPVSTGEFLVHPSRTPFTNVLSDPGYHDGSGERTFINNIGAAGEIGPDDLPPGFLDTDILCLGGTAIVPTMHDELDRILAGTPERTYRIVNTVFDFRNEQSSPGKPWPLGKSHNAFRDIDLLIMDREEALKISAKPDLPQAVDYFRDSPLRTFVITDGPGPVTLGEGSRGISMPGRVRTFPVSRAIVEALSQGNPGGDTTGAGDNFVGGMIYSIGMQLSRGTGEPDLVEAVKWGIVSGGFACFYMGGTYLEKTGGEKLEMLNRYYELYTRQLEDE